jgi:hypothetical protein
MLLYTFNDICQLPDSHQTTQRKNLLNFRKVFIRAHTKPIY